MTAATALVRLDTLAEIQDERARLRAELEACRQGAPDDQTTCPGCLRPFALCDGSRLGCWRPKEGRS